MPLLPQQALALKANLAVMDCLDEQIRQLESVILKQARDSEVFQALKTVPGIGKTLALTIALESGDMSRFASAGNFASYARTVDSRLGSNGKNKGKEEDEKSELPAPAEFASKSDYQLNQDLNLLKGLQIMQNKA